MRHIQSVRGATNRTAVLLSTTTITTPGATTYTLPTGTQYLDIELRGGGGGGGSGRTATSGRAIVGYGGGGAGGGEYVRDLFYGNGLMQGGDVLNLVVGRGGTAGINTVSGRTGAAGIASQVVSHTRNGSTLANNGLTHDTGIYVASYGVFYSISAAGGFAGKPASAIPAGAGQNFAVSWDVDQATARVIGSDGQNNSGTTTTSPGGSGGAGASGGGIGGRGATAATGLGTTGSAPGGGGGGGFGSAAGAAVQGTTGADGQIVIKAYG